MIQFFMFVAGVGCCFLAGVLQSYFLLCATGAQTHVVHLKLHEDMPLLVIEEEIDGSERRKHNDDCRFLELCFCNVVKK